MVYPLKIIIIGSQGFIGSHFCRAFPHALAISRTQLDLEHPEIHFPTKGYACALIAAGIGNPRYCEQEPEKSYTCNVTGTLKLGKELLKRGVLPIFFSTDYVLDDSLHVKPLNAYGRQKAELEQKALELGGLIIRLSKVYGMEKGDKTLFDEMAAHLTQGNPIRAAHDQIFAPVFVGDVIKRIHALLEGGTQGLVHICGPSFASRLEMALLMAKKLNVDTTHVKTISLADLQDGVIRPKRLALRGDFEALTWQEGVERVAKAYAQ